VSGSKLELDRTTDIVYGMAQSVAPKVERIVCENPGPFTFTGTNSFILDCGDALAVVDPGPQDQAHLNALTIALGGRVPSHILVTHTHRDHSPLAFTLKMLTGAEIVGCTRFTPAKGEPAGLDASHDVDYVPDRVLEDGETIEIGDATIEAVATPGHTANHLAFSIDGKTMLTGDHVMAWSTTVVAPPDGKMGDYLASLEKLLDRPERTYLPAHGPALSKPKRFVRGLITHRRQREKQIMAQLKSGADEISAMVPAMYPEIAPALHRAAGLSVQAHLEHMAERGIVEIALADDGTDDGKGPRYHLS
jgi:glyoxylase-like metal-dependent hydrolase (beta-lactamase superfamily II)